MVTDCANIEEELFVVLLFDPFDKDRIVHVKSKFLSVTQPCSAKASADDMIVSTVP